MKRILVIALLIFTLAGCQQPIAAPPTTTIAPPTATVAPPTATAEPATETPAPPTETAAPTVDETQVFNEAETAVVSTQMAEVTDTPTFIPWTLTPTPQTDCEVTLDSPKSTDPALDVNAPFDGKWTVKNISDSDWLAGQTDIVFESGTKFQTKGDGFDLAGDVAAGSSFDEVIDMKAPASAGKYSAKWGIVNGGNLVCTLDIAVTVK